MFLVDTSVTTRLASPAVRHAIEELDAVGLARSTMTDLEVGFSAHSALEWDALHSALDTFRSIEIEAHHFRRAGEVQRVLADQGLRGRKVPDLLIAAAAEAHALTVLHYDIDFDHIASVTGQPTQWVVPRGSID